MLIELRTALEQACCSERFSVIDRGRDALLEIPREVLEEHLVSMAHETVDLDDPDEYRRLLEAVEPLELDEILECLLVRGRKSSNPDVREIAEDFA